MRGTSAAAVFGVSHQRLQDHRFAGESVLQQPLGESARRTDRRPMAWQKHIVAACQQAMQRREIGGHVAVRRRNHAGRPRHHMVGGEHHPVAREGDMVGRVARRVQRGPSGHDVIVVQRNVGRKMRNRRTVVAIDRRSGGGLQRRHGTEMVGMRVAEQNARDPPLGGGQDRLDMRRIVRAGVEHAEPVIPRDEVGVGAMIRHRPRVRRDDACDPGPHGQDVAADRRGFGEEFHAFSCAS